MRKNYSDEELLENFLKDLEGYITHLPVSVRYEVLNDAKNHILKLQEEKNQSLPDILRGFSDRLALVNHFLIGRNQGTVAKKKKGSIGKYILLGFLSFIVLGSLATVILVKSMMPLFEFNDEDGTLTLLGGKITLEKDDETFFTPAKLKHLPVEIKGEIPSYGISKIFIRSENVNFAIRSSEGAVKYNCKAEESKIDVVSRDADQLTLNFPTNSMCMIYLPKDVLFSGEFENGVVNIKDIKQSFKIKLTNGTISWKQVNADHFYLEKNFSHVAITGPKNLFNDQKAPYKVQLTMENGILRLRQ